MENVVMLAVCAFLTGAAARLLIDGRLLLRSFMQNEKEAKGLQFLLAQSLRPDPEIEHLKGLKEEYEGWLSAAWSEEEPDALRLAAAVDSLRDE